MTFKVIRHEPDCGGVLMDAYPFKGGPIRVRCSRCKERVWLGSDGETIAIIMVDVAPATVPVLSNN